MAADLGNLLVDVRVRACLVDRRADRAQEYVGQLERVLVRDVEPVEQPVADEVEVVVQRLTRRRGLASQALEQRPGSSSESKAWRASASAR